MSEILIQREHNYIKINLESTAKGTRVSVVYDRADHDQDKAIEESIAIYKRTIEKLDKEGLNPEQKVIS